MDLKKKIEDGTIILLERGWSPDAVLREALVEGMRIVGIDFRDGIFLFQKSFFLQMQ
jgi:Predicted cobalamin binding protein